MPDPTPDDSNHSPAPPLTAEQAAAIQGAKPLTPRPRPAFTRKSKPAEQAAAVDMDTIPEAVPLDDIPEGIPLDNPSKPRATKMADRQVRTPGNRPIRPKHAPQNRSSETSLEEEVMEKIPIDKSKFVSFEKYEKGEIAVKPLEKLPGVESRQVQRLERPKFLDGELSRRVERGVQYPLPGRVLFTSVVLLLFKLSLLLTVVGLTAIALLAPENMAHVLWLPASLVFFGILFVASANRTRCRICSCHMFYNRRCFKHQKAHRLFGLGHAGSAALHAILFKWLRCMYCGTAIRLRPPKPDSEEAEVRRSLESQEPDYDKSLIKPRPPK
jgi:hypothetical protein